MAYTRDDEFAVYKRLDVLDSFVVDCLIDDFQ